MEWRFDGSGEWEAESILHDDGSRFVWRIQVCEDGTFDASRSDRELLGDAQPETFGSLQEAREFCESHERNFVGVYEGGEQ